MEFKFQAEIGVRTAYKVVGENFWGAGNLLYLDCGGGYMTKYI